MRGAVIDLGSNTFHTLVAEVDRFGIVQVIHDEKVAVRLGADAFATGRIPEATYTRALAAASVLIDNACAHTPDILRIVATGVFREVVNGRALLADIEERHDLEVELVDGPSEAALTWLGVSAELAGAHGRLAIVDVGGGSLECVAGSHVPELTAHSFPLGVLRLRTHGRDAIRATVASTLAPVIASIRAEPLEVVAISSGTARALLRLCRNLGLVGALQRHLSWRSFDELARILAPLPASALEVLGVEPARHDTIATGACIFASALELLGRPVVYVAASALREGALIDVARRAPKPSIVRAAAAAAADGGRS